MPTKEQLYLSFLFVSLFITIILTLSFSKPETSEKYMTKETNRIAMLCDSTSLTIDDKKLGNEGIDGIDILPLPPLNNKSIHLEPENWLKLTFNIFKIYSNYDSFIVVQNVENIPYLASALTFMLENLNKPIILTDNKPNHISNAILLATGYSIPEIVVVSNNLFYRGCQTTIIGQKSLISLFPPLGKVINSKIKINEEIILESPKEPLKFIPLNMENKVVKITLFPGITHNYLIGAVKGGNVDGIVLEMKGNEELDKPFLEALKIMLQDGVFIASNSSSEESQKLGIISNLKMTIESIFVKLYFLISNVKKLDLTLLDKLMRINMRGEIKDYKPIKK